MSQIIWSFKPIGYTPVDVIREMKHNKKITFCGRLDPMAYGLIPLIVVDTDMEKVKEDVMNSYKTYRFSLISGIKSDTYDILGIAKYHNITYSENEFINRIYEESKIKEHEYPPFSSKTVYSEQYNKKVPLWRLSTEGILPKDMPKRDVDIKYINILSINEMNGSVLLDNILERIDKLPKDSKFRQFEIIEKWRDVLDNNRLYKVYNMETLISSGTYVRTIGNNLGGTVYDIFRISVGDKYLLEPDSYDKYKMLCGV